MIADTLKRWYADAVGGLHWPPSTFWRATLSEYVMAIEGHNRANRVGPEPMTRERFEELEAIYYPGGAS